MKLVVLLFISFMTESILAQNGKPVVVFERADFTSQDSFYLLKTYGANKEFVPAYTLQSLIALSYFPELKDTHIRFVFKPAHSPFETKPVFPNLLYNGEKRKFIIIISDSSMWKLEPVLIQHMDFNEQIGIIGHELSHVSDFSKRTTTSLIGSGIKHVFSSKYIDRFEFRTDSICIAHGLGYQLLAWSVFVRRTMHTKNWEGADNIDAPVMTRERYMNPSTIRRYIAADSLYSENGIR
jgi:hypothetical protein